MDLELFGCLQDETERRRIAARKGKAYLLYCIPRESLLAASDARIQAMDESRREMLQSQENKTLNLTFDQRPFPVGPVPIDLRVPDQGLYCRFTWNDMNSDPQTRERINREALGVFSTAQLKVIDVTDDLDRIFLFVFGQ